MIQPTADMVQAIYDRLDFHKHGDDGIAEGLAVVLNMPEVRQQILRTLTHNEIEAAMRLRATNLGRSA
jgi:hypothetical protein